MLKVEVRFASEDFIKEKDKKHDEVWSEDNGLLADCLTEFAMQQNKALMETLILRENQLRDLILAIEFEGPYGSSRTFNFKQKVKSSLKETK